MINIKSFENLLSIQLLRKVFGGYVILAVIVTAVQLAFEYDNTLSKIESKISALSKTSEDAISQALWTYNRTQLQSISKGLIQVSSITALEIFEKKDQSQKLLLAMVQIDDSEEYKVVTESQHNLNQEEDGSLRFSFPVFYQDRNQKRQLGTVVLYSSRLIALEQLKYSFLLILINSLIKTLGLWLLFIFFMHKLISKPLEQIENSIFEFEEALGSKELNTTTSSSHESEAHKNEISRVAGSFRKMTQRIFNLQQLNQTQKQQLEELVHARTLDLQNEKEKAEEANKAKTLFLAKVSHEFRTPLNAISGFTQLSLDSLQDDDETKSQKKYLSYVKSSSDHLYELIEDVISYAEIESGKLSIKKTDGPLSTLLDFVSELSSIRAGQKDIEIVVKTTAQVPEYIRTDHIKLRQILINLLSNAIKFSPENSKVYLKVFAIGEKLEFKVIDYGTGIAPENVKRIFKPFEQEKREVSNSVEGTGLGLSICQRFAILMEGELSVESKEKVGSIFTLVIPYESVKVESKNSGSIQKSDPGAFKSQDFKILIAEDNLVSSKLLEAVLLKHALKCEVTYDGEQALNRAYELKPQIILLDYRMPKMTGLEVARALRKDGQFEDTRIFLLTAEINPNLAQEAIDVGIEKVFRKPIKFKQLILELQKPTG